MSKNVLQLIETMFEIAQSVDMDIADTHERKTKDIAHSEILNYLLYLSASDGSIEAQEAAFIKDYLHVELSPAEMCEKIEDENIYSTKFEQKIPIALKRCIRADNHIYEKSGELSVSRGEKYICFYEAIGTAFAACDREVSVSERENINTYLKNMRSFYNANYSGPKEATEKGHLSQEELFHGESKNQPEGVQNAECTDAESSLEDLLDELNSLIGLTQVKGILRQLIHFNAVRQTRQKRGMPQLPISQHMVFYGNPGTGKTTVARLIAKIYHKLGILSNGQLVEVDRSGLVAGYVGHTALKVKEVVKEAKGGILFIDEAYSLTYKRSENDFGQEAVDTLIKAMEDEREDLVVIVAGYTEPMIQFINSNPGLKSRFNRFIHFEDYSVEELMQIYRKMCSDAGYNTNDEALKIIRGYLTKKKTEKGYARSLGFCADIKTDKKEPFETDTYFSNARMVRNMLETAVMNQADRLYSALPDVSVNILNTISADDVSNLKAI